MGGRRTLDLLRRSHRARRGSVLPKTVSSIAELFPSAAAVSYMRIASCMLIPSIRYGGQISMTQRAGDLPVRIPPCVNYETAVASNVHAVYPNRKPSDSVPATDS